MPIVKADRCQGYANCVVSQEIDTFVPHSARMYDYFLGGGDNFAVDRDTASRALEAWPAMRTAARENRAFLGRAVRYLAEEAGITQLLDIGSGLPSVGNVHEVAQEANPAARVVYVDNDHFKPGCSHALVGPMWVPRRLVPSPRPAPTCRRTREGERDDHPGRRPKARLAVI
jgi:hypothetical protein